MEKYKKCPNCGTNSSPDAQFCIKCGFNLQNETVKTHVNNGEYFKLSPTEPQIIFSSTPAGYALAGPIAAQVTFNCRADEDYGPHMDDLFSRLNEVLTANHLNGVSNLKISSHSTTSNNIVSVTILGAGDGLKKNK